MHRLAHGVVPAKRKRNIAETAARARARQVRFDPADRFDEIDRVVPVLFETGRDREHVRIENDVVRRNAGALGQEPVGARANVDPTLQAIGLPAFVECHHDHRRAVLPNECSLPEKFFFAVLQTDRIDDRLALDAFQAGFDHAPFRAVDHHRHAGDFWLAPNEVEEARHRRFGIDHPFVHVDVENVRPAADLLACHRERRLEIPRQDQFRKFRRARDVGPFAHHHEPHFRRDVQRLEP